MENKDFRYYQKLHQSLPNSLPLAPSFVSRLLSEPYILIYCKTWQTIYPNLLYAKNYWTINLLTYKRKCH
jgi:hypothetical protein